MPCYSPIEAWKSNTPGESGKYPLVFKNPGRGAERLQIPCGQCIGCKLEYSRQLALRATHEAQMHDVNCFITLTYADEHLPADMSITRRELDLFIKRLRKRLGIRISHMSCGEYGDENYRPHYHACIFGYDFSDDRKIHSVRDGMPLYTSDLLSSCWKRGFVTVADFTFETAAYVSRYVLKKITGDDAYDHYQRFDEETGEITLVEPEFISMSRNPALGKRWFEKYYNTDLKKDFVTVNGRSQKSTKYYDKLYAELNEFDFEFIKDKRRSNYDVDDIENFHHRLRIKEAIKQKKLNN